jgi:tetratricopeptide (TPR) repeat protein
MIKVILFSILLAPHPGALLAAAPPPQRPGNQKVIKDPAEYNAYVNAISIQVPAQRAAALEAFVREYPESVVKVNALEATMAAYQQAGNTQKLEATARRILEIEPLNARALAIVTFIDRNKANSGDTAALQESCEDAQKGLSEISRMADRPTLMNEGENQKLRLQIANIFLGAAGNCALQAKNYAIARNDFSKALQINPENLEDNYQNGIAGVEMMPLDASGFWYLARAINLAQNQGNIASRDAIANYARARYHNYHGSDAGWDQIVTQAANQSSLPNGFAVSKAPTPAELAVQTVQQNDPATLSFSDWESVLKYRDASPANQDAADKVWQAIQNREKNGQEKLKIPVKVISANKNTIVAAITSDNQSANTADLQASLEKPLQRLPVAGTTISLVGVINGYTPDPFMFTMNRAELYGTKPAPHTQLSENDIVELLQGGVSAKRATELVKEKGVDFALDSANEARLRKAGATDELLLTIATSKK